MGYFFGLFQICNILIMENEDICKKTEQLINKNRDLLDQKKYYEFAQKMKLLSNRKQQSRKFEQAICILQKSSQTLLSMQQAQQNIALELTNQLVTLFIQQPTHLTIQQEKFLLQILQLRPMNPRKIQMIRDVIVKIPDSVPVLELKKFFIECSVKEDRFFEVEELVAKSGENQCFEFVDKWTSHEQVLQNQIPAIWCRMAILRTLFHGIDKGQQMLRKIGAKYPNDQPYTVYTGILLKTIKIQSKQAYLTIQKSYQSFLESDEIFKNLFQRVGRKFFGIDNKKNGIFSLIS